MVHRREALGRNRRGPSTTNIVPAVVVGIALLAGAGVFAFTYFTAPERVLGSRELKCPATEISWRTEPQKTVIQGCGKTMDAACTENRCSPIEGTNF